jgi:hypothetical protein
MQHLSKPEVIKTQGNGHSTAPSVNDDDESSFSGTVDNSDLDMESTSSKLSNCSSYYGSVCSSSTSSTVE